MQTLPAHLNPQLTPPARPESIVSGEHYRITVLTERLLRLEYSPNGEFEDRATQTVVNRDFDAVDFRVVRDEAGLQVITAGLQLIYDEQRFSSSGLLAHLPSKTQGHRDTWRFGVEPDRVGEHPANLGGTARTLDDVDGACLLEPGLMSIRGYALLDDSATMAIGPDGWVAPRVEGNTDLYLFAHGHDFKGALWDFYRLTGPQPLLPRFALGNWWSRYHAYSAAEYTGLMERFQAENLPFSVAVLDMDWHLVDVPPEFGAGWTGYTWNTELFPDPAGFLADLHDRGLKVALNVHPADGVRAYESAYPQIAEAMGIDPDTRLPVHFDIAKPSFLTAYLEHIHHPLEEQGVDFWWLDWQQGNFTSVPGLDPLWMLNHFHFLDSARGGQRPLTFSRYAGPGSHRYPVGFSGDTIVTWESLAFQPYFTATASNIGYGWWSHDIGGHMWGNRDDEMATRWFQFGVFSPLNRLHSSNDPFAGKEPWNYDTVSEQVMGTFLRLRHRLLPYLYTMNERAHSQGLPIVLPLYYEADRLEALESTNSYLFGSELLVAAITEPTDRATRRATVTTWLPAGTWIDFFTGTVYGGDRWATLHRELAIYPVLARAGAIVPMIEDLGVANPTAFHLHLFAGADGDFTLYEDDDAATPRAVRTRFTWSDADGRLTIHPGEGELDVVPASRVYTVSLFGLESPSVRGRESAWDPARRCLRVELGAVATDAGATVRIEGDRSRADNRVAERIAELVGQAQIEFTLKSQIMAAVTTERGLARQIVALQALTIEAPLLGAVTEILLADA